MSIVYSERILEHSHWKEHPESPLRIKTMKKKLVKENLWEDIIEPLPIKEDDLFSVHTKEHIEKLKKGGEYPIDQDTFLHDSTYDLAMLSAAVACTTVDNAMKGKPTVGITRPPGHHAGKSHMGGFCYLNNAAIAAQKAGVKTAIVDLDAHHCNGTEEIFYDRDDVLVISVHEADFYWNSGYMKDIGVGKGKGYNVNIPIPPKSGNSAYMETMEKIIIPILKKFNPELIIVEMGVDGHYCDQNSHMVLNTKGYIDIYKKLLDFSENKKIAYLLEGGYHLRATAEVVAGVVASFYGKNLKPEYNEEQHENAHSSEEVEKAKEFFSSIWKF